MPTRKLPQQIIRLLLMLVLNKMNKKTFTNLITSSLICLFGIFVFALPVQAGVVQFGNKQIFVDFDGLPFNLTNWAPGMNEMKSIRVDNNEHFDINVYLKAEKISGDDLLAEALTITTDGGSNHLIDLFTNNTFLSLVDSRDFKDYDIAISFDKNAGNEYQNKVINFNFIVTVEEIGGGGSATVIIPGGGGSGYYYIPPATIPTTDNGQVTATPGEGGITTLVNPDGGGAKLVIPAGAVEEDTVFTIILVDVDSITEPMGGLFIVDGFAYQITAMRNGKPVTTFPKSLVLTLTYTDEQIDDLDESSFKFYYFSNGEWVTVSTTVDINDNTVTVLIDHLTLFALMGAKETEAKTGEDSPSEISPRVAGESTVAYNEKTTKFPGTAGETGERGQIAPGEEEFLGATSEEEDNALASTSIASRLNAFLAAAGSAWRNLDKLAWYNILGVVLLAILILIGIKIWRKWKKRKQR